MSYLSLLRRQDSGSADLGSIDTQNDATASAEVIIDFLALLKHVNIALLVVMLISIILRFYVRLGVSRLFGPEDWAMVATSLFALIQMALGIAACVMVTMLLNGNFQHAAILVPIQDVSGCFYVLALLGTKISIGYFFLHLFSHKRTQRIVIYTIMGVVAVSGIVYIPLVFGTCAQFKETPQSLETCPVALQTASNVFHGIFSVANILGDFIFCGMAVGALIKVRLPLATKISASFLVVLGSAGGVATAIRMGYTWKSFDAAQYTQEVLYLSLLQTIEMATGIIAANLAMIRPLFHKLLSSMGIIGTTQQQTTGNRQFTGTAKSASRRHGQEPGDELLLDEIKRDMTVTVQVMDANDKTINTIA